MINAVFSCVTSDKHYPTARRNKPGDLLVQHERRLVTSKTIQRYIPARQTASFSVLFSLFPISACLLPTFKWALCETLHIVFCLCLTLTQNLERAQQDLPANTQRFS